MKELKVHPAADIFPLLEGAEFDALVADIREHGQREPILTDAEGVILDGRNRWRACEQLGIKPRTEVWYGKPEEVIALVVSLNIVRRHLDASLRAVLSDKVEEMFAAEAKERQRAAGREHGRGQKLQQKVAEAVHVQARDKAAKATGANRQYVSDVKALRKEEPELYEAVASGKLTVHQAKQKRKAKAKDAVAERIRNEPMPLPGGQYRVIVVDPPWPYDSRADDETHRARNPYPSMTLEAIRALPVASLAQPDAILWLWTTNAFIWEVPGILAAWGFEPKTVLTWIKPRVGLGNWLRGQTEHCVMATKGKPAVTLTNQTTALHALQGAHSTKPDKFYALVESLCPGSKLELFSRTARAGWQAWGAEAA